MSRDRYNQLAPTIYPIPGTVFESGNARSALTPGLAAGVVGAVGPITAQELGQLGAPYDANEHRGPDRAGAGGREQLAASRAPRSRW